MVWDSNETMARADLEQLQLERLRATLYRVMKQVPFYRNRFSELKIDTESFTSLDDLRRLPFTTKQDLRNNYPYGMFAVPLRDVVRIHSSSGTTGMATVVGYTRKDIDTWSDLVARILTAAGVGKEDVIQIAFGYGLFTGGFGLHYGAEKLGASVIPISAGNTRRQIQIMQDFKTHRTCLYPLLCPEDGGCDDGHGHKPQRAFPEVRPFRGRALVGEDEGGDQASVSASWQPTTMACPKSWGLASQESARSARGCMSMKIISWWKYSTPRHLSRLNRGVSGSWSSPP